jgi:hypothetical protein
MSSDTDTGPEQASRPDEMSPEELDRALRWLEELGGKGGESAVQPLDESPFHGLFDLEEGDVPAWLRETPSTDSGELAGDTESRLDWLAKMAQRESIEELPTLEWRRLSDSQQASVIAASVLDEAKTEAFIREPVDAETEAAAPDQGLEPLAEADPAVPPEPEAEAGGLPADGSAVEGTDIAAAVAAGLVLSETAEAPMTPAVEVVEDSALVAATIEVIAPVAEAEAPGSIEDAGEPVVIEEASTPAAGAPQLDDMDAAMAWLEELAARQETPIEDLPSVADRALASKLMAEASQLSSAQVVQPAVKSESRASEVAALAGASLAGATLYEAATDESLTANLGDAAEAPAAGATAAADAESVRAKSEVPGATETGDMAKAVASAAAAGALLTGEEATTEVVTASVVSETVAPAGEPFEKEASMPVKRKYATKPTTKVATAGMAAAAAVQPGVFDLGDALEQLDLLAVPARGALDDIERVLAAEGASALATPYSLEATLDWLLPVAGPVLDSLPGTGAADADDEPADGGASSAALSLETSLVDDMPEDPDAALAWMSQFVDDEPREGGRTEESASGAGAQVELSESILLEMPDDPDEAIAWLEKLASQGNSEA